MDVDDEVQQQLLSKLSEYGDSLLDEDDYIHSKKKAQPNNAKTQNKLRSVDNHSNKTSKPPPTTTTKINKGQAVETNTDNISLVRNKGSRQFWDFEDELKQFKDEQSEKKRQEMEAERSKEGGKRNRPAPEVIVFEDPSRRKKKKITDQLRTETSQDEFNLRKARLEVRQFGLTGFSFEDREKCEADRAISLGAWAPKRECINYKEYMVIQKKKKEQDRQQREMDRKMGYNVAKKPATETTRVKNQGFWRDATQDKKFFLDGQIGRYKHGVQVVSKDDVTRAKARSKKGKGTAKTKNIKL